MTPDPRRQAPRILLTAALSVLLALAQGGAARANTVSGSFTCGPSGKPHRLKSVLAVVDPAASQVHLFLFDRQTVPRDVDHARTLPFPWREGEPPLARMTLHLDPSRKGKERLKAWQMALTCEGSGILLQDAIADHARPEEFYRGLSAFYCDLRPGGRVSLTWKASNETLKTPVRWDLRLSAILPPRAAP